MKRVLFVLALSMVTIVSMGQGHHGGHHHDGHHGHHGGHEVRQEVRYIEPASPEQLGMVLRVMEGQSFDDKKLEIAKLSVCLGHFSVRDMAQMASLFSFDDKRKEFFIYAYPYCYDRENYYSLRDVFSFRSNFDEVMETVMPGYRR